MAILEKVNKMHEAIAWEGDLPIQSRYSAGIAGERFLREIKDNARFVGTYCEACDLVYVPAVMFCERCFDELDAWVEVPNRGMVFTYTLLFVGLDGNPLDEPVLMTYVKLDGTDGGLVHYLGDVDPEDVYIGMEVEAVFKEPADREGSILDVTHFRPVED